MPHRRAPKNVATRLISAAIASGSSTAACSGATGVSSEIAAWKPSRRPWSTWRFVIRSEINHEALRSAKSFRVNPLAAPGGEVRPVGREEGIGLLRAHVVVPERAREDVVDLAKGREVFGCPDPRRHIASGMTFAPACTALFETLLVPRPAHDGKVNAIRSRRHVSDQPDPRAMFTRAAARCEGRRQARRVPSPSAARRGSRW